MGQSCDFIQCITAIVGISLVRDPVDSHIINRGQVLQVVVGTAFTVAAFIVKVGELESTKHFHN